MAGKKREIDVTSEDKRIINALSVGDTIRDIAEDKKSKVTLNDRQIYFRVLILKQKFGCKSIPHLVATFLREKIIK
jgi:hypothetical protein